MIGIIFLFPIGVAISFSYPMIKEDSFLDLLLDGLGWGLFLTYIAFRLWATLYIGGRKDKQLQDARDRLPDNGPCRLQGSHGS